MESENAREGENEKAIEALAGENDDNAGKDGEVVVEAIAEKDENVVVETSAGEKSTEDEKLVETFMDAKLKEAAPEVVVEENKTEIGTVKEPCVEASSSGMKKPQGLRPKAKIVRKVKRLVRRKIVSGTASKGNVTVEQGIKESITAGNIQTDEQSAEPGLGEKDKDLETSLEGDDMELHKNLEELAEAPQLADDDDVDKVAGAEPAAKDTLKEVKGKATILKSVGKILQKGKYVKGTLPQGINKESATTSQGCKEGVNLDSTATDQKHIRASPGENVVEAEKAVEGLVEKKKPRKLKAKAKLRKIPAALLVKAEGDKGTPRLEQTGQDNNNSLHVNNQHNCVEKVNSLEVNTTAGAEKSKHNQLTQEKTGLAENKRLKKKRQGKQIIGSNKKQKKEEVAAAVVTQQKMDERREQLVEAEKRDKDGNEKKKIGGLIFMCNAKTKPDCLRFSVMGVPEKRKDYVMGIKPGIKLFLYDYDLKLLYGVFQATSVGGMKLERNAFGGSFPAQVRFKVVTDCIPLPETQFRKAIEENYNNKHKFKTELTYKQVFKLTKLFRPAPLPAQITHVQPILVPHVSAGKRSDENLHAPGSSRTHLTHTHERRRNASRREEPPSDLYLSEREYRTYGLRRGEPIPPTDSSYHRDHVTLDSRRPILPPDSSYNRDHVTLDSYRPSVDHDRLLRHAEMERHDRSREVRLVNLPERDYHLSGRREILARQSPETLASVVAMESYRRERDPYYSYEYRAPERTYLAASSRENDDLYSRYVTPDSLAEYYRSSSSSRAPERPPRTYLESVLPPSSVTSRYAYSPSLPYSHR